MIPLKLEISCLDGYLIRNIIKREKEKLEKDFQHLDELSMADAYCDIAAMERIICNFQEAIDKWEKENK